MKYFAASVQYAFSDHYSKQEHIERMANLMDQAKGANLIVLPETWAVGFRNFDQYRERSENIKGETIAMVSEKARELNAYILAGTIIEKSGDKLYNTAVLLDPNGRVKSIYRKMHLVCRQGSPELELITRGTEAVAVETELGIIGFSICYDLRYPELFRKLSVGYGAEVLIVTSAWPMVHVENWHDLIHARAAENQSYLISCNCTGSNQGTMFYGHSAVVNPYGITVSGAGLDECVIKSEVNLDVVSSLRSHTPNFLYITYP